MKAMLLIIQMLEDDNAVVSGCHEIVDMSKATMGHFLQMTPALMKKMSYFADEAIPIRQKGAHFINTPIGFEQIFNVFKNFLTDKIKERVSTTKILLFSYKCLWIVNTQIICVTRNFYDKIARERVSSLYH